MKDNKTDSVSYSIFFQIFTGVVTGIFAFFHGFHMPNFLPVIPNVVLMIFCYSTATILVFKSLALIEASEFTVLFVTRGFWTVLTAVVFLGEAFSIIQILGAILIGAAVVLVSYKAKKFTLNRGSVYAIVAAILFGIGFTNDAFLVRRFDAASYEAVAFVLPGIVLLAVYAKSIKKMASLFVPHILLKLFLLCTIYATAAVTVVLAYQAGRNAAQLGALSQTTTILTVLFAVIFLKETSNLWKKIIGAVLAFVGIVLIG